MAGRFTYFVVLADMRTGSNFLEANLNAFPDIECHGELFNPSFVGHHNRHEFLGYDKAARERDPIGMIEAMKAASPGAITGFRLFPDHDERVLSHCLADESCAKVILTRNPLDSYISLLIARETGQWRLTDAKNRKAARVRFEEAEFVAHLERVAAFQRRIREGLQTSGQAGFHVGYDDLGRLEVMNGLGRWLGSAYRLERLDRTLKRQNPGGIEEKLVNPEELHAALVRLDPFSIAALPAVEPERGPNVRRLVAAPQAGLLFLPLKGGPEGAVRAWLQAVEAGAGGDDVAEGLSQKEMRQLMRRIGRFTSFAVVRHPIERVCHVLWDYVLGVGNHDFADIRQRLRAAYAVPLPEGRAPDSAEEFRQVLERFLVFLKANLAGQTSVRIDAAWASQAALLEGMARFHMPHRIFREEEAAEELPRIAGMESGKGLRPMLPEPLGLPWPLADVVTPGLDRLARQIYRRDCLAFGFGPWRPRRK